MKKSKTGRLLLALVACGAVSAQAALLSSESFSGYTIGAQLPDDTPSPTVTGYTGDWAGAAFGTEQAIVTSGSLVYGGAGYAAGTGDHVARPADTGGIGAGNSGRSYRMLDSSLVVDSSTAGTLYLSWLFQTGNENAAGNPDVYQVLGLWNGDAGNDGLRTFEGGIASGDFGTAGYGFRAQNNAAGNLGVAADSSVHLFVAKFDLSATAASDSVTVWLDPTLGAGDPSGGVTISGKDLAWDRLTISDYASNSSAWDEVRFGTSFDDVTVIPEPATIGLAGLCGVGILFVRRRFLI